MGGGVNMVAIYLHFIVVFISAGKDTVYLT